MLLPACAVLPHEAPVPLDPVQPLHVLFVADGAGDYRACSAAVRETAQADGWPLDVITFVWSHGYLRNFADETDYAWARQRGRELARVVQAQRQARPDLPVSLLAHSAGAGVVLAAAEELPPNTLDRVVLLAPSVSSDYDLRGALRATQGGVDVFYSRSDRLWLGLSTAFLGTSNDRSESRASGRFGFEPANVRPEELPLFAKLRQYEWNVTLEQVGNDGGHFGAYQPGHLRRFVLPLFRY
jgi:pimeloyl-ACP methyl ester carboxylesterase